MPRQNGKNVGQNGKNVGQNGKDTFGKAPCYNTVENWVKKLGLSVFQDDQPYKDKKFAMVVDESIAINGQKN